MIYQYPNVISFIRQSSDRQMSAFINLQSSHGSENLVLFTSIVYVYETLCSNDWQWDTLISHFFLSQHFFFFSSSLTPALVVLFCLQLFSFAFVEWSFVIYLTFIVFQFSNPQIREQMSGPDLQLFTLKLLAVKKTGFFIFF